MLGHLQRGGAPTAADRLLATQYGCKVLDLVRDGQWDHMVALRDSRIVAVPLSESTKGAPGRPDRARRCASPRAWAVSFGD